MIPRLAVVALWFALFPVGIQSQEPGRVTFESIVKSAESHATMYGTNRRIVGTSKRYSIESKAGQSTATLADDRDFEIVRDAAGKQRYTVTASRLKPASANTGSYTTPEITYSVQKDGDQFTISNFIARSSDPSGFVRRTADGPGQMPSSFDGHRSLAWAAHVVKDSSHSTHAFSVGTPTRTTRLGRAVIAVTSDLTPRGELAGRAGGPVRQTSYFDPANSCVYLGSESSEPATTERPWARVTTCTLEYRARDGTFPVPKRFTRYVQPEKGEKLLEFEIDYTRFEDFVPDPEDFRLEKRYGLTTPAGPDGKALVGVRSAKSSRVWYWVGVLVVALLVGFAGTVYFRRRKTGK